jgi:saccharopine dehydrogenase (NADP+, L-glutamate forming)
MNFLNEKVFVGGSRGDGFFKKSPPWLTFGGNAGKNQLGGIMSGKLLNGQPVLSAGCGKKVLVLGAGRVSKPAIDYLLDQGNIEVTTADFYIDAAKAAAADRDRVRAVSVDARNREDLAKLVKGHDAVICLVNGADVNLTKIVIAMADPKPAIFTTDYVKPGLEALMQEAANSNTYVLTGVGTDPGIDHAAVVQMKNNIEKKQGKIKELYSLCGSLPAKENSNSWGMRLGWLPTGIVDSTARETSYKKDGKIYFLDTRNTFEHAWEIEINGQTYEANSNEMIEPYLSLYRVEDADSVMRGTLRCPGWRETVLALRDLGFYRGKTRTNRGQTYDLTRLKQGKATYRDFVNILIGKAPPTGESMRQHVARHLGITPDSDVILRLEDLGLFKDTAITSFPLPNGNPGSVTGSDILVQLMLGHPDWNYQEGQRDIVVMKHILVAQYPGGVKKELTSTLVLKGDPFQENVFIEENHRRERFGIKVQAFPDGRRGVYLPGTSAISWSVGAAVGAASVGYLAGETDVSPGIKYGPLTESSSRSLLKRLNDIGICLVHHEKIYDENNPALKKCKGVFKPSQ